MIECIGFSFSLKKKNHIFGFCGNFIFSSKLFCGESKEIPVAGLVSPTELAFRLNASPVYLCPPVLRKHTGGNKLSKIKLGLCYTSAIAPGLLMLNPEVETTNPRCFLVVRVCGHFGKYRKALNF